MKNTIKEVIQAQSREEYKAFRDFIMKGKNKTDRKDLQLAEALRKGNDTPTKDVNAYRLTKKRLKKQLEKFALLYNATYNNVSKIYNLIEMARYLLDKNLYEPAWEYLYKAEIQATKYEEYALLNFIYYMQISYYTYRYLPDDAPAPDILKLLKKYDNNLQLERLDANGNSAFALLTYELSKRLSTGFYDDENTLINKVLSQYQLEDRIYSTPKIYSRVVNIVCWALVEQKDYEKLSRYAMDSYETMQKQKITDKVPQDFMMEFLSILCLSLIRTKNYNSFEKFRHIYEQRVERFKAEYDKYISYDFRSGIMTADFYMFTNQLKEARQKLNLLTKKYKDYTHALPIYFILRINLIALHFAAGEHDVCIEVLKDIMQQNHKKIIDEPGLGVELMVFTELYGAILYYEKEDFDYANYLLKKLKRRYAYVLNEKQNSREYSFAKILEKMTNEPLYIKSNHFKTDVTKFCNLKAYIPADREYISLNAWLRAKLTGKTYYECFLELVK